MKIITQDFKTGELKVEDAPRPALREGGVLVANRVSLVSAGTERAVIALAKKGPIGKALDRPDLAKQVLNKAKTDGWLATYSVVKNLLKMPLPLGYSCAGEVLAVGRTAAEFQVGQRVACAGIGYANHAEIISVPKNLVVPVPDSVSDADASFVTLGAIALHGLRQSSPTLGESVVVIGLGLVGQLAVQLSAAHGLSVIGVDIDERKFALATAGGARHVFTNDEQIETKVRQVTSGRGADIVLICAAAKGSSETMTLAGQLVRDRGRVVVVGEVNVEAPRRLYFEKEIEILMSRSYGPGRYDPNFEEKGQDYPLGYVRWTERRNFECFLDLAAQGRINPSLLVTHRFDIEEAERAYAIVTGEEKVFHVALLLDYPKSKEAESQTTISVAEDRPARTGAVRLAMIGAGTFARGILMPAFRKTGQVAWHGVATQSGLTAGAVAKSYGAAVATSDSDVLLNAPEVDAVVIATRHNSHASLVADALSRGKAVFVEKPLATNPEGLEQVRAARQVLMDQGKAVPPLLVGFNRRHSPLGKTLIGLVRSTGAPFMAHFRVNAGAIQTTDKSAWVLNPDEGGGRLVGEVCHFIDFLVALRGCRSAKVSVARLADPNPASADSLLLTLAFADGSVGSVLYACNGDRSFPKERVEVFAGDSVGVLDNFQRLTWTTRGRTKTWRSLMQDKGHESEVSHFIAAVQKNDPLREEWLDAEAVTRLAFDAQGQIEGV
ncbi:MAG: bi-domain-containing oxidoreductase [Chthoniobacteraceae bacterium]